MMHRRCSPGGEKNKREIKLFQGSLGNSIQIE